MILLKRVGRVLTRRLLVSRVAEAYRCQVFLYLQKTSFTEAPEVTELIKRILDELAYRGYIAFLQYFLDAVGERRVLDQGPHARLAGRQLVESFVFQEFRPEGVELVRLALYELSEQGLVLLRNIKLRQGGVYERIGRNG